MTHTYDDAELLGIAPLDLTAFADNPDRTTKQAALDEGAAHVIAIELDPKFARAIAFHLAAESSAAPTPPPSEAAAS